MSAINLGSKLGENLIINPSMDIWQRGLSLSGITSGRYNADRFRTNQDVGYNLTIERSADVPVNSFASYSMKITNTAQKSVGVGETLEVEQKIEGFNSRKIKNKNAYFAGSFKTTVSGTYSFVLANAGNNQVFIKSMTLPANTWTTVKIPISKLPTSVGTWDFDSGVGLFLRVALSIGTNLQRPSVNDNQWLNDSNRGIENQVDFGNVLSAEFYMTQLQLHEGIDEIPFDKLARDIETEIKLCQRYFEKSYNLNVAVGATMGSGSMYGRAPTIGTSITNFGVRFSTRKRTTPVPHTYSNVTGLIDTIRNWTDGADIGVSSYVAVGETGFFPEAGSFANEDGFEYQWTADAEL